MRDLEKSFAEWRWQMLAAGIKAPEPLEELELHLRDEVDEQLRRVDNEEQAFAAAVEQLGSPGELKREFRRAASGSARLGWIWVLIGGFGLAQTAMLNFVGPMIFHRHSSPLFSHKWWADWSPSYLVWVSLFALGAGLVLTRRRGQGRAVRP
jgi:hypothetical protein